MADRDDRDDEATPGQEGLITGLLSRIRGTGEAAIDELSSQLMENPTFMSALRRGLEAKGKVDRTVRGAMDFVNVPSKNDVDRLLEELDGIRTRLVKQQRALKKLQQGVDEILDRLPGAARE